MKKKLSLRNEEILRAVVEDNKNNLRTKMHVMTPRKQFNCVDHESNTSKTMIQTACPSGVTWVLALLAFCSIFLRDGCC